MSIHAGFSASSGNGLRSSKRRTVNVDRGARRQFGPPFNCACMSVIDTTPFFSFIRPHILPW